MLRTPIIFTLLTAAVLTSACRKSNRSETQPEKKHEVAVLGYSQNTQSQYENHHLWTKDSLKTYTKLNLIDSPVNFALADGENVYIAQNGSFWKNGTKTDLFQPGGVTTNVAYKYYNQTLGILVRKPAQEPGFGFDYSIMEGSNTIFTVAATVTDRYEFKDFMKVGNSYYLLGSHITANNEPVIYARTGTEITLINLKISAQQNFHPNHFQLSGSKFHALGYINANGVLHPAILSLNIGGSDKVITELNLPANTVVSHMLIDGNNFYVTGWEPKGDGSYSAFYLKNNQKFPLSSLQSRAMQIVKSGSDIYVAGLEWTPSLSYKIWKNGQLYGEIKTGAGKPIIPMQLIVKGSK